MKVLFAALAGLAMMNPLAAYAGEEDDLPKAATVRLEKKIDDLEKRVAALEGKSGALPKANSPTQVSYRSPRGHTHTCPNCGDVWDHDKNPTHNCQQCGTPQYVVDPVSKPVNVQAPAKTQTTTVVSSPPTVTYTLYGSGEGGCPNGQCNAPAAFGQRRGGGLFGWRNR